MSLTVIQQMELLSGELKPPTVTLDALVHQCAYVFSKNFYDSLKDTTGNDDATAYATKMINVVKRVYRNEAGIVPILHRVVSTIIGASSYTYAQVENANDDAWAAFVLDQIDEAFEYVADVRDAEKTAYAAI